MPTLSTVLQSHLGFSVQATPRDLDVTFNFAAGDYVVVAIGAAGANVTFSAPTIPGLTFSNPPISAGTSSLDCRVAFWISDVAAAAGTGVGCQVATASGGNYWGFGLWVVTGSSGVGATASIGGVANGATSVISLTTDGDSTVLFGADDWTAQDPAATTVLPTGAAYDVDTMVVGQHTMYLGHLTNTGIPATKSYGLSGITAGKFSLVAVEFKKALASGDVLITPSAVATTAGIPAVTVKAGVSVSPAAVAAVAGVPTASVAAGIVITPAAVAATAGVPAVTQFSGIRITPAAVAAVAGITSLTGTQGALTTPAAVAAVSGSASFAGIQTTTISVAAVAATAQAPAPVETAGSTSASGWYLGSVTW